ncbi:MIT C-terminal domain-containing protein [Cyclobacterium xiamenense]|nr:MIT C-terminal domain-containing protein [Cyclobacterium xiamenense]
MELDSGWKIILGRGLDIWKMTSGRYSIAEYYQE